jgi:hypothetical protein
LEIWGDILNLRLCVLNFIYVYPTNEIKGLISKHGILPSKREKRKMLGKIDETSNKKIKL